jgi:hypothetical protein
MQKSILVPFLTVRWRRVASLLFLSKVGLSLWVGVYTLLGGLTILATETAAGHDKLEEDSQVSSTLALLVMTSMGGELSDEYKLEEAIGELNAFTAGHDKYGRRAPR